MECKTCLLDDGRTRNKKPILTEDHYKKIILPVNKRRENEELIKEGFKICNLCNRKLPLSDFSKHKRRLGGVCEECKQCVSKRNSDRYEGLGFAAPERIKSIRQRSRNANLPCDIDQDFLEKKFDEQHGLCFYSNLLMTKEVGKINTASVDRMRGSKGYTKNNVVLCCDAVNMMKSTMSYETFYEICKNVADNRLPITDALKKTTDGEHWRYRASCKKQI